MMLKRVITLVGLSLLGIFQFACNTSIKEPEKPNFIFIYADNLGYGDIGCFGSKLHRTPNIEKRTMIVFTSDNGSPLGRAGSSGRGSNEPFSGAGYSTMEGGMRVPCVVQWTGTIPPGISNDELCTMMDWLPTFASLAVAPTPRDRIIDGKNIWPMISGEKNAKSPHEFFNYYFMDQLQAVRDGKWKLHLPLDNKYEKKKVDINLFRAFYGWDL